MPSFGAGITPDTWWEPTGPTVSGSDTIGIAVSHHADAETSTVPTWDGNTMTRLTPDASRNVHVFYIASPASDATVAFPEPTSDQALFWAGYWTDADTPTNDADGSCSGTACEVTATTSTSVASGSALVFATTWHGAGAHNDALGTWEVDGSTTGVSEAYDAGDGGLGNDMRAGMGYDDDAGDGTTMSMSATPANSRDRDHDGVVFEIPAVASADQLDLDHLDASPTFYSPELVGFVDLDHLDASPTFYSPEVVGLVDLDHLDASPTFHTTELVGFVDLSHLDASPSFHSPEVAGLVDLDHVDLDHLDASPTFHTTELVGFVDLDHLDASPTFHTVTVVSVGEAVDLDHLNASPTFHTLVVGATSIDLDHLNASPTFPAVSVFQPTIHASRTGDIVGRSDTVVSVDGYLTSVVLDRETTWATIDDRDPLET